MRRMNLALLALLQLGGARARSFSVHEDLQAFPQVCYPGRAMLRTFLSLTHGTV